MGDQGKRQVLGGVRERPGSDMEPRIDTLGNSYQ
jgi:hypothetical protein